MKKSLTGENERKIRSTGTGDSGSRLPKLSARLRALFDLVPACSFAVDVGCDHGYIPIALVQSGKCENALACDVRKGPLERAEENIQLAGLEERIKTVLSDGLLSPEITSGIDEFRTSTFNKNTIGTLIIAGMGGILMKEILEKATDLRETFSELVLQPQSDVALVRSWLAENGWKIRDEFALVEDGKYYEGFAAERGKMELTEAEAWFGPVLLQSGNLAVARHLLQQKAVREEILMNFGQSGDNRAAMRKQEIQKEIEIINKGIDSIL